MRIRFLTAYRLPATRYPLSVIRYLVISLSVTRWPVGFAFESFQQRAGRARDKAKRIAGTWTNQTNQTIRESGNGQRGAGSG